MLNECRIESFRRLDLSQSSNVEEAIIGKRVQGFTFNERQKRVEFTKEQDSIVDSLKCMI